MRGKLTLYLTAAILGVAILALLTACQSRGSPARVHAGNPHATTASGVTTAAAVTNPAESPSPPRIPHIWEPRLQCLECHGPTGFKPVPPDHAGRTVATCASCHQTREPAWSLVVDGVMPIAGPAPATPAQGASPPALPLTTPTPEASPPATPPPAAKPLTTPPASPAAIAGDPEAGKAVYNQSCNLCHPGGEKGIGPSLKRPGYSGSEAEMIATIRQGRGAMPAFPANRISDQQLADIIAYLNSLQ